MLHELVHSSGHVKRLNREGITSTTRRFGDPVYAFEELIAELGSAFLCAHLGVYGEVQHDSYIDHWLMIFKSDKKALFRASRMAREASEYLLKPFSEEAEEDAARNQNHLFGDGFFSYSQFNLIFSKMILSCYYWLHGTILPPIWR